ncbi:hypothetical protein ACH4YO_27545 [Streptomyces noursei]|uniref:hypothetical protein n=1 Tax=Streptomyces noursei TaxID=1971 RepID=UPI0034036571
MARGTEHRPLRWRLIGATVVVSVLAGALGAGSAVAQNSPAAKPQARPQSQAQPQPRAAASDEEYANLYTHTVGNVRSAMLGDEAAKRPGSGHPDPVTGAAAAVLHLVREEAPLPPCQCLGAAAPVCSAATRSHPASASGRRREA